MRMGNRMGYGRQLGAIVCCVLLLPVQAAADAALCDQLAGASTLPGSRGTVDRYTDIDTERAIPVCTAAVARNPASIPTTYRLVRALAAAERWQELEAPLQRALDAGYGPAYTMLGTLQFNGFGQPKDVAASLKSHERAVALGYKSSAFSVAWYHHTGTSVPKNVTTAARHYRVAAEADFMPAQTQYALMLLNGEGVKKDDKAAYRWAQRAASRQDAYGSYLVGFMLENGRGIGKNVGAAAQAYAASAAGGNDVGRANYARVLEEGKGIEADPQQARVLYRAAAANNLPDAQARLGRMLRLGRGGGVNLKAARSLFEKAGERSIAQHQLGLMHWNDEAGLTGKREGYTLIRKAADGGLADAQVDAARIMTTVKGGEPFRNERSAVAYLEKAVAQNHREAQFLLGKRLTDGDGVGKNADRGLQLLEAAARQGHEDAATLAKLERQKKAIDTRIAELRKERCDAMIRLCNRGCEKQDDGSYIYNTHDGKQWFHESGRLLPASESPDYGCPQ